MSWQLASFLILGGVLAVGFVWYERSRPPARVLALVSALAALAVVGRLAFAPIPNVKPTTDIVLFAGYALGGAPGFAVGAVTALVSNIFFAHGPWTPWQMAAWGGVGIAGGGLGAVVRRRGGSADSGREGEQRELGRWSLAVACGLAGLAFGLVMDLYLWTLGAEQTPAAYAVIAARSAPFNVAHIAGNVVFCLLIGPPLVRALRRYRQRFEVSWPAPAGAAPVSSASAASALVIALVLAVSVLAGAPPAEAAPPSERAARYLAGAQNGDGGLGGARGNSSSSFTTLWGALGLASANRNPRDVSRDGNSTIDYLRTNARSFHRTGDIEKAILVLRAAGLSPRRFAGRNLYRDLLERRRDDGSFDGFTDRTAFGVLAMRAARVPSGSRLVQGSADWLADHQNDDGGFGSGPGRDSDVDDTGAVLQALRVAGSARGATGRDAVRYLTDAESPSGGFGFSKGRSRNAQSTAYAVQGLIAAGAGGGRTVRRSLSYLRSLSSRDGSIRHSRGSSATPVWVTSQVLLALHRKTFPLARVPLSPAAEEPPAREPENGDGQTAAAAGGEAGPGRGEPRAGDESPPASNRAGDARGSGGLGEGGGGEGSTGSGRGAGSAPGAGLDPSFGGVAPKGLGDGSAKTSPQGPKPRNGRSLAEALSSSPDRLAASRSPAARAAERANEARAGGALLWSLLTLVAVAAVAAGGVAVRRLAARRGAGAAEAEVAQPEDPLVSKT